MSLVAACRRVLVFAVVLLILAVLPAAAQEQTHPRLWVRAADLSTYRSWAVSGNPLWVTLNAIADERRSLVDSGAYQREDLGTAGWESYPVEDSALLLALMSLIHPDDAVRAADAARARALLLHGLGQAALGVADAPFRYDAFALSNRSRWTGAGWPLTVDWIYPTLTPEDKALIHGVFTRWCAELRTAGTTNNNHPEPVGAIEDPALIADRAYSRWSNNNYYAAHMRNMGLMALAFDAADDRGGILAGCLTEATGAWLYVIDHVLRTDVAGGMGAEGFEYSPQTHGYIMEFLLALYTAGQADPAVHGPQVSIDGQPFWDDALRAYFASLSPRPAPFDYRGDAYQPAWYGSGQNYLMPDHIELFGALGIYDRLTGNTARYEAIRWAQTYTPLGLEEGLLDRMDGDRTIEAILYFLLMQPDLPPPADPRPALPTTHYAPGIDRLLMRTDWTPDATLFTYALSWNGIDHQSANGNTIELYRGGEWLTRSRIGYDLDYLSSDHHNTLTVAQPRPDRGDDDFRVMLAERGSQWLYVNAGDPPPPRITHGDGYVTIYGDATPLYNSTYEGITTVEHVSRSVVWLLPDTIVIYDQARTQTPGFQRFWLNLPAEATLSGGVATMRSPGGQQFAIHTLIPADARTTVIPFTDEASGAPAVNGGMPYRFRAELAADAAEGYFLHVLTAADADAPFPLVELIGDDPRAPMVRVGGTTVSFSGDLIAVGPE